MKGRQTLTGHSRAGFTIVEILVVVIVIGILVGVVVVSYNGAQIKAENAKTSQAVSQYVKAVTSYAVRNGAYPISTTSGCLGTVAACARVSGAATCFSVGAIVADTALATTIATEINPAPEPSAQTMTCSTNQYKGAYYAKNDTTSGKTASITYFLRGNQTCSVTYGTLTRAQQDDTTSCVLTLPTLP